MDGQVSVFDPRQPTSPCYACVFPPEPAPEETRCATLGVFAPLVGIIGSVQAAEALKLISHAGSSLAGRLLMLDARHMDWREVRISRHAQCPAGLTMAVADPGFDAELSDKPHPFAALAKLRAGSPG